MPYYVPNVDPKNKWYQDMGLLQGAIAKKLFEAFVSGQIGKQQTTPTAQNPGQIQFPSGKTQSAGYDPLQVGMMGGPSAPTTINTSYGSTIPAEALSGYGQPGGPVYKPPTAFSLQPNLARQQTQADIAYKQAQTQSLTPEFQAEQYRRILGLAPTTPSTPGVSPTGDVGFTQSLQTLRQKADAGDEGAVQRLRLLLQLLQAQ